MPATLRAPLQVEFDYTRSLGPVLSAFMTGLRDRRILGGRVSDGRVVVPPPEYDPETHDQTTELVAVGTTGTVRTWSWVSEPVPDQPLDRPFAFALVLLDGADTPLLHAVDAGSPDRMSTGMRVRARWADETIGHIRDIACFEPVTDQAGDASDRGGAGASMPEVAASGSGGPSSDPPAAVDGLGSRATKERGRLADGGSVRGPAEPDTPATGKETAAPATGIVTPVRLGYTYAASSEESRFLRGLAEGKILAQRCPACGKVYVPPRGACPVDGVPTRDEVELPDRGIVTTFCIVNVPFLGQRIEPPYVSAYILLDGADIAFLHLVLGCEASEVRMGMRVEAVWRPREEWGTTMENIDHFRPSGEPDAPYETYAAHL